MKFSCYITIAVMLVPLAVKAQMTPSAPLLQKNPMDIGKIIKNAVEKTKRQNIEAAEASGDYSKSNPAPAQTNFTFSSPDGKISVPVEIKGIVIGMSLSDFVKVLKNSVPNTKDCQDAAIETTDMFPLGDYVVACNGVFSYFGTKMRYAEFYFLDEKVKYVRMGSFYAQNDNGDPLPPIVRTLAEDKFKMLPKADDKKSPYAEGNGIFKFMWTDEDGGRFLYATEYSFGLSGAEYKKGFIEMLSSDFEKYTDERRNMLRNAAQQEQKKMENKRKSDL